MLRVLLGRRLNSVLVPWLASSSTDCGERVPHVSRSSRGRVEPDMQDRFRPEAGGIEARSGEVVALWT